MMFILIYRPVTELLLWIMKFCLFLSNYLVNMPKMLMILRLDHTLEIECNLIIFGTLYLAAQVF